MPKYTYRCEECKHAWEIWHSFSELPPACPSCEYNNFIRIPASINTKVKTEQKEKIGVKTEEFIKASRSDLEREKEQLKGGKLK